MALLKVIIQPDTDDPDFANVLIDVMAGDRPYRVVLDTGAARSQLPADEYTSALPVAGTDASSGAFGDRISEPLVTIENLAIGSLQIANLTVTRSKSGPGALGMDVLGQHRCHFRLGAGILGVDEPSGPEPDNQLTVSRRGHPYVEVHWPGVTASACWDTGSGPTIVDRGFWLSHPELFEQVGATTGTDSTRCPAPDTRAADGGAAHRQPGFPPAQSRRRGPVHGEQHPGRSHGRHRRIPDHLPG